MKPSISVLLVDDHAILREMLDARLACEPDITVAGTVSNAEGAVQAVSHLKPDVIVMDIDMPGLLPFEAARIIASTRPETAVVFFSAFCHDRYIEQALAVGAAGYVSKSEPTDALIDAIRTAASGGAYYSPQVQSRIVAHADGPQLAQQVQTRASTLSQRETEVLGYVCRGLPSKKIAATMRLSVRTVDNKVTQMMSKLGVHNRIDLVRFAFQEGLAGV